MHRIPLKWTLAVLLSCMMFGCSASPEPMIVLAPTYSFNRDGFDIMATPEQTHLDPVASVEP